MVTTLEQIGRTLAIIGFAEDALRTELRRASARRMAEIYERNPGAVRAAVVSLVLRSVLDAETDLTEEERHATERLPDEALAILLRA